MPCLALALRLLLAAVFLFAAALKTFDPAAGEGGVRRFARLIEIHGLVPPTLASGVAPMVLIIEALVGACLLVRRGAVLGAWASLVVLATFSTYMVLVAQQRGFSECACFGSIGAGTLPAVLARNIALSVAAAMLLYFTSRDGATPEARNAALVR
jgi:hypothetical protein